MSAQGVGAFLCGLGGGLIFGALLAHAEATSTAEIRSKNRYEEQLELHKRILQRAHEDFLRGQLAEHPVETEDELVVDGIYVYDLQGNKDPRLVELERQDAENRAAKFLLSEDVKVGGEIIAETPIAPPDYVGTASLYADPGTFINGEQVLSLEYIEAEDYEEEDGRAKEQITIFMGGDEPIFVMDGEPIENWAELIGDHILVDFYQRVPPGEQDRVLYVRNHKRDEDYEVWQTVP